jgi:hypothetical protein
MATSKNEKQGRAIETAAKSEKLGKLRTLSVRSGVTAGLARMGCSPCHKPTNHNETLVER